MQRILTYCVLIVIAGAILASCRKKNELPSLKETFSKNDKIPFGTFVAYNQATQLFYRNTIRERKQSFEKTWKEISDTGSLYISISRNLYLTDVDKEAMLSYVEKGNSLFISSANIDEELLHTLGCYVERAVPAFDGVQVLFEYTGVKLLPGIFSDSDMYRYYYFPFGSSFSRYNANNTKVLGLNESGKPDYIVIFYGKGRFYLHCEPRAFSNYFLLQKNNYRYWEKILAFTPETPELVYWDDYYNRKNYKSRQNGKTGLSVLLQYPSMAWAFWLLLLLLLLYVLFGSKRKQRVVEALVANKNTTVAFTETVGRLYLQKKDNRNIADKLITYFLEHLRNQYFLNTNHINDDFITSLGRKSGVPKEVAEKLFAMISEIQQSDQIDDKKLLALNQLIENFTKNKT